MAMTYTVDLDQIQGNVTPGFRKDHQEFLFFRLPPETFASPPDRMAAKAWLQALRSSIATAREVATFNDLFLRLKRRISSAGGQESPERYLRSTCVNVAFTHRGHAALYSGPLGSNAQQSTAFRLGMFNRKDDTRDYLEELAGCTVRDSVRGDLTSFGAASTDEESQVAHVLVIIGADSPPELDAERLTQVALATSHGLVLVEQYSGVSLGGGREHFGFKDGISQPDPNNLLDPAGWVTSEQVAAPGEFIRGAGPEPTNTTVRPVLPWETNGSYLVLRRLDQDVQRFRTEGVTNAAALSGVVPGMTPALFEAKCVGRWPDGTPVDRAPLAAGVVETAAQRETRLRVEASTYSGDPDGVQIPRFAHIRKAYPRDRPDTKPRQHRLIRRGIPFGPVLPSMPEGAQPNTEERGLIFAAYMASIEQQFEFLMRSWFGSRRFAEVTSRPNPGFDPIMGRLQNLPTSPRDVNYAAQVGGVLQHQQLDIRRYITLKGGGYFFSPSIAHLATLASP
jgi:Dyp-type peroxidase family